MGGFGAVYLATDTKSEQPPGRHQGHDLRRPAGVRHPPELLPPRGRDPASLETVPIVPRVFDLIEQGQTAHLVMEFIRGKDLLKIMEANDNKPFPMPQVIEWGKAICDVLHAHAHPVAAADPPRPEAGQHHAAGGPEIDQDDRLRHGPRPGPDRQGTHGRQDARLHRGLRAAGADRRQARAAQRPVRPGRHAVSPGDRQGARGLLHRQGARDAARRAERAAAGSSIAGSSS